MYYWEAALLVRPGMCVNAEALNRNGSVMLSQGGSLPAGPISRKDQIVDWIISVKLSDSFVLVVRLGKSSISRHSDCLNHCAHTKRTRKEHELADQRI